MALVVNLPPGDHAVGVRNPELMGKTISISFLLEIIYFRFREAHKKHHNVPTHVISPLSCQRNVFCIF